MNRVGMVFGLSLILVGVQATRGEEPGFDGIWSLVVLAYGDDEFARIRLRAEGDGLQGEVLDAQPFLGRSTITRVETRDPDGPLSWTLQTADGDGTFRAGSAGVRDGTILGTFAFQGSVYPARLERTDRTKVAPLSGSPVLRAMSPIRRIEAPRIRHAKLLDLINKDPGSPANSHVYEHILRDAGAAAVSAGEVRTLVDRWIEEARPYGEEWTQQVRLKALRALGNQAPYIPLSLELARAARAAVTPDTPLDIRAEIEERIANAATRSRGESEAVEARSRLDRLQERLDDESEHRLTSIVAEPFGGRKTAGANRVVLVETFTGAQCLPCVGSDVAFDGLLRRYRPADVIGLSYHVHLPVADPLTCPSSLDRAEFYGVKAVPATFVNGQAVAGGGGSLAIAESKYQQIREVVEPLLEESTPAQIELEATLRNQAIWMSIKARDDDAEREIPLRLRLAVVENRVRFAGTNQLGLHRNVVRAMPGGPEGLALQGGTLETTLVLSLKEIRLEIETHLDTYQGEHGYFPRPGQLLDPGRLSVVAFLQDDTDRSVRQAVQVELGGAAPRASATGD